MTIWSISFTCRIPKTTDTHSEYVIRIAVPLQQWLHECASLLRYTYIDCLVKSTVNVRSHGVIYKIPSNPIHFSFYFHVLNYSYTVMAVHYA